MSLKTDTLIVAGVAIALIAGAWYLKKKVGDAGAAVVDWVGSATSTGAAFVDTAVSTPVLKIGDAVGLPRTDKTQCQKDLDAGNMWDASFSCPAGTFIGGAWDTWTK